jgi:uncharacterized membrane protein
MATAQALTTRVNSAALPVCIAAMDSFWIYIATYLISSTVLIQTAYLPVPSPFLLATLELLGFWLASRLLDGTELPLPAIQAITGAVGVVASFGLAVVINFPPNGLSLDWLGASIYSIAVGLVVWFLGTHRASDHPTFTDAYTAFRTGLLVIGGLALLTALLAGPNAEFIWSALGSDVLWFFCWSLLALALGNRELVRQESGRTGMNSWGLVLAVSVGGVLLIGFLGGAFGGHNLIVAVENVVKAMLLVIGGLLYAIAFGIAWLLSFFGIDFGIFKTIFQPSGSDATNNSGSANPVIPGFLQPFNGILTGPPEVRTFFISLAAAIVVLVVILVGSTAIRRARRNKLADSVEDRESLGGLALLMQQLRKLIDRLLGRFRSPIAPTAAQTEDDLAALRGNAEWSGTLSVRQIYARLQALAARTGYPRAPQQTPVEYLTVLTSAMPDLRSDFTDITSAYIEARYGRMPASAPAVMMATNAWKRAEPALKSAAHGRPR